MIAAVAFFGVTVFLLSVRPASVPKAGPLVTTSELTCNCVPFRKITKRDKYHCSTAHTGLGDIRGTSHLGGAVEAFYAIP